MKQVIPILVAALVGVGAGFILKSGPSQSESKKADHQADLAKLRLDFQRNNTPSGPGNTASSKKNPYHDRHSDPDLARGNHRGTQAHPAHG